MKTTFAIACLAAAGFMPFTGDVTDDISAAIRTGNSKELTKHFSATVTLTILDEEDSYSREQAGLIIKDFFTKNPPKTFSIVHKGTSKEGARYAIGSYQTEKRSFRTYFLLKKAGEQFMIDSLSFELDDNEK